MAFVRIGLVAAFNVPRRLSEPTRRSLSTPRRCCYATAAPAGNVALGRDREAALVDCFDYPSAWASAGSATALHPTGLFGDTRLTRPESFGELASATMREAEELVTAIAGARSDRGALFGVVRAMDRLSNVLCTAIDLAELIRNTHPDAGWASHANAAYESLCEYMNVLNTEPALDETLRMAMADQEVRRSLSKEALMTADIFLRDFDRSGIRLPQQQRSRFVSLSSEIITLGRTFLHNASKPRPPVVLTDDEVKSIPTQSSRFFRRTLTIQPGSPQAQSIMHFASEESARRKVYMASSASTPDELQVLERLLKARAELAQTVGFSSYAAMTLSDKMARSPENVMQFLDSLVAHMKPATSDAIARIRHAKARQIQADFNQVSVYPWDKDFFLPSPSPSPIVPLQIPSLTVGTVFRALSRLFTRLYGISLRPIALQAGEAWLNDVQKLEVVDEDKGILGWIYTDLFQREGKANGAAHYTVQCSRLISESDGPPPAHGRVGSVVRVGEQLWQLPVVVLTCQFTRTFSNAGPGLMDWHEVQTLFHEMGHAIHSMIGRTEFHNVSGTRCATDLVELPSILMEHFLASPEVVALLQMDPPKISEPSARPYKPDTQTLDDHHQIIYSLLDQAYHSTAVLDDCFDSLNVLNKIQQKYDRFLPVSGNTWQAQFGHLYGYGASYYSYIFDRSIASQVWKHLFQSNPLSRKHGDRLKTTLLCCGGGKEPWEMVSILLDEPLLADGGAEAMNKIGEWTLEGAGLAGQNIH